MKLSGRIAALAFTAAIAASALGAQNRNNSRAAARGPAPRANTASRARPEVRPQRYVAARAEPRARVETRTRADYRGYTDNRARVDVRSDVRRDVRADVRGDVRADVRGGEGFRGPVEHGRPLITRAGYRGVAYGGGFRYWRGVDRFGVRISLPFGWERPLFVRGYFPSAYYGYCDAVPPDLYYMMPPMYDGYDSCLIGDRIVVYDRFSRGISFVAVIP